MAVFERYKEYLLGDYCYGLRAEQGGYIPPWTLVLNYEHAIRKQAYKLMASKGLPFGDALAKANREPSVKERNFPTPLALWAKRPEGSPNAWETEELKKKTPKGKGKDKGKKGKKGEGKTAKYHNRTPEGKPICYRYNSKAGCKKGDKCHFVHVCFYCYGKCQTLDTRGEASEAHGAN